jgi:myo-inositol-1(or 4)-monophosphatase
MSIKAAEQAYLRRIEAALSAANTAVGQFVHGEFDVRDRGGRDVVTEVDRRVSDVLREILLQPGEGWLSEEDVDDKTRLSKEVVWVVDPLDGTREFVDRIPEWSISIGLTIAGTAVAGGILNPASDELFLGSLNCGVTYNGRPVQTTGATTLEGASVLASRQEYKRGEWAQFEGGPLAIRQVGSVAYKLALVAAGLADATWTLSPKHEWDVAAGVALVNSAGGKVCCVGNADLRFNRGQTLLPGLVASGEGIWKQVLELIGEEQNHPSAVDARPSATQGFETGS